MKSLIFLQATQKKLPQFRISKLKRTNYTYKQRYLENLTGAINYGKTFMTSKQILSTKIKDRKQQLKKSKLSIVQEQSHKWFKSRGKQNLQAFNQQQLSQLKYIFKTLDYQGNNYLHPDQLYQPFSLMGLIHNQQQLNKMVYRLDQNGNNRIQFQQFMKIAKMGLQDKTATKIKTFFQNMQKNQKQKPFRHSFMLFFSKKRRDNLMQGLRQTLKDPIKTKNNNDLRINCFKKRNLITL